MSSSPLLAGGGGYWPMSSGRINMNKRKINRENTKKEGKSEKKNSENRIKSVKER
jgi:hypothetical protein